MKPLRLVGRGICYTQGLVFYLAPFSGRQTLMAARITWTLCALAQKETMNEIRLPYGLQGSELRHISDVASGLACKCFCPCCGSALVARKGKRVQHHFSHYDSTTCSGSTETALHLAAKEILEEAMAITLPSVNIEFDMYQRGLEISPSRRFNIDKIQIETRAGSIVPDLIACLLYTSPSPRDKRQSRMPSSA